MALGDKAGLEAVQAALPVVRELLERVDKLTLEIQALRAVLEQKQLVIRLEDKQ